MCVYHSKGYRVGKIKNKNRIIRSPRPIKVLLSFKKKCNLTDPKFFNGCMNELISSAFFVLSYMNIFHFNFNVFVLLKPDLILGAGLLL